MLTRATKLLKQKKIAFEIVKYEHKQKGAEFAAEAINFPLEKTIKTLVADIGKKGNVLVLMPGTKQLDLKRLSTAFSVKKSMLADRETAERVTGYLVGGISPFETRKKLPSIMDESLLEFDEVAINAGQRGVMLILKREDMVKILQCDAFPLSNR